MKYKYIYTLLILFPLNCFADQLCSEIVRFANETKSKKIHSVALVTDWSNFTKACAHNGYTPAKKLCNYLMENISTEFMDSNVSRVLACISNGEEKVFNNTLSYEYASGKISTSSMNALGEGIEVKIEYSFGIKKEKPKLIISALRSE